MSAKPLSQLRMEIHQEDHPLRALLFGGGTKTTDGLLKGDEARSQAADVLNRVMYERLDLVGEIASLRARIAQLEVALREIVNTLGPDHFSGELQGLVAEGNEALRVARAALSSPETEWEENGR